MHLCMFADERPSYHNDNDMVTILKKFVAGVITAHRTNFIVV